MGTTNWLKAWEENNIAFHQGEYHANLVKYWREFTQGSKGGVFVPLCGKSLDMVYLIEQGHSVYGVELSSMAVEAFFRENGIMYTAKGTHYSSEFISIYADDIFNLRSRHFKSIKYIYDRAALVALPPKLRVKYVRWLSQTFPNASILLESFEFNNSDIGPPFSITDQMIKAYYGEHYKIQTRQLLTLTKTKFKIHQDKISSLKMRTTFLKNG